jgi:hypothetical protein
MEKFNAREFIRQMYLRSEPSVDLATFEGQVDCTKHKLKISECDKIYEEFGVEDGTDLAMECNMWLLGSGPQLVEG